MATKHNQKFCYIFFFISIGAEQLIPDYVGSPQMKLHSAKHEKPFVHYSVTSVNRLHYFGCLIWFMLFFNFTVYVVCIL
jgi:hypothetical protein